MGNDVIVRLSSDINLYIVSAAAALPATGERAEQYDNYECVPYCQHCS
jgi:hypothetical protein